MVLSKAWTGPGYERRVPAAKKLQNSVDTPAANPYVAALSIIARPFYEDFFRQSRRG